MTLGLIVLLPFLGSLCAGFLPTNARNLEAWLAGLVTLTTAILAASLYPEMLREGSVSATLPWLPDYGLTFQLRLDGYAWMFAMLVTVIGAMVIVYARYYMSPADPVPRFFAFLLAFMGSMLGIVLSGNLIQLVVFWELTSFTSFMLIAYWHHRSDARRGARMALVVTSAGGLFLLAGMLMLGHVAGSYELEHVLAAGGAVRAHPWYPAIVLCVVLGAFTKSAQFPFHFWLPHAMAAPTPVSAYLHSATMVKAGVFLLARLWPVLAGTDLWFGIVCTIGLASLLVGACAAFFQRDMKGVLAYSTISHLGLITLLLGMNSALATVAAVFHMMNHATFKASLFMAAGIVDHETGTRDLKRLGGLARAMPITATLATVAAAAMAGVPLLNGFLSKEMFFAETVFAGQTPALRIGLPAAATVAGMFSVAYSLRFILQVFFGPPAQNLPRTPHEPYRWMLAPSAILVVACVLVGIFPARTIGPVLHTAAESILGPGMPAYSLAVWHGLTLALLMSVLALVGGVAIYMWRYHHPQGPAAAARTRAILDTLDGRRMFDVILVTIIRAGDWTVRRFSSRRLQIQLVLILVALIIATYTGLWDVPLFAGTAVTPLNLIFLLTWVLGAACALGAATQAKYHRLAALIMLSGAGLVTCLTFAWFSAPDLALTQVAVEVVTTVLLLLGLRWLPKRVDIDDARRRTLRARARRVRDISVAVVTGLGVSALTYIVLTHPATPGLSGPYLQHALPDGGGRNVVNVILVDFRGFDTLGEITVVSIVALTVFALLRRFRPPAESIAVPRAQTPEAGGEAAPDADAMLPRGYMQVPAVLGRLLLPVATVISFYYLLRGHNAPGGGFVGGLVLATAFILQYMVGGAVWVESQMKVRPQYWIAAGLLAAAGAGMGAWLAGKNFLSNLLYDVHVPLFGEVHLSSTLLFDIGVYMVVVGSTTLMLIALAHQSLRSHRRVATDTAEAHTAPVQAEANTW